MYYPFIDNKTVIMATVVWRNLSKNEASITHYRLKVITLYDMAMNRNEVSAL